MKKDTETKNRLLRNDFVSLNGYSETTLIHRYTVYKHSKDSDFPPIRLRQGKKYIYYSKKELDEFFHRNSLDPLTAKACTQKLANEFVTTIWR